MKRNKWTREEIKLLKDNYEVMGAKALTNILNRTVNSITKKAKEFKFNSRKHPNIPKDKLEIVVNTSISTAEVMRKLDKTQSGDSYKQIKRYIEFYNIDTSHFNPFKNNGKNLHKGKTPIEQYLQYGSGINSSNLKKRLYEEGLKKPVCEKCSQGELWNGDKMSLVLDHINGDPKDNVLSNLRIVCPNCNATLPTHCIGNKKREKKKFYCTCGNEKVKAAKQCLPCASKAQRKVKRPSKELLLKEIKELGYCGTGRKYGVSDNAVRKWIAD